MRDDRHYPRFGVTRDLWNDQIEHEAVYDADGARRPPVKQKKAVDYRAAGEVAIHLGVEVWRRNTVEKQLEEIRELYVCGQIPALMNALRLAYQVGRADAQRELAEELTGGSSILRDPADSE